ncbi:MAG: homoserine dehydrogenase [Flavobacteriales bacterium]|nr:homoserine dehydrogenase [Flavobacteriales bacterium]
MNKTNNEIGLFGFGTVGKGFYHYVSKSNQENRIPSIVTKGNEKDTPKQFLENGETLIQRSEVGTIVELINNEEDALKIVTEALELGKTVVSANKKLIAENLKHLLDTEKKHRSTFLYEGAVCGSIPIIRILNDFYSEEPIQEIKGIFNGSSNYILTQLFNSNTSYAGALQRAQELGFAEKDPTSDVGGFDALYKLIIITTHAFGTIIKPTEALNIGIETITKEDIDFAKSHRLKIKQIAKVSYEKGKISLSVAPTVVDADSELYTTEDEYNGVLIGSENVGKQFYKGKGAGSLPTGSVVYSDLKALDKGYKYSYSKIGQKSIELNQNKKVWVLVKSEGSFELPHGFSNITYLEKRRYLAETTLADLSLNKENLTENGLSVIFIDNKNITKRLLNYASAVNTARRAISL